MRIFGIDPGQKFVGVSDWIDTQCVSASEWSPEQLVQFIRGNGLMAYDVVVIEAYSSQGGYGSSRAGVETIELIGFMAWSVRIIPDADKPRIVRVNRGDRHAALQRLEAVGYPFQGRGVGNHARDAEAVVVAGMKWSAHELAGVVN